MKIIIIQEAGRHKENAHMRECFSLQRAFDRHPDVEECVVWGNGHPTFRRQPKWNSFDIIINIENYSHGWMPDLSKTTHPTKFMWSIDAHCGMMGSHAKIYKQGNYDYMLQASSLWLTPHYNEGIEKSIWFPNAYDDTIFTLDENTVFEQKPTLLGFCGSKLDRDGLMQKIAKKTAFSPDYWVLGKAMIDKVRSYKMHLNPNLSWDVNYRNFETMGLGTVILANNDYNVVDYRNLGFEHGINCLLWERKNIDGLLELISEYSDPAKTDELKSIGKSGHSLVSEYHTYYNRVNDIIALHQGKSIADVYAERPYESPDLEEVYARRNVK